MTRSTRTVPMLGAAAAIVLALTACSSDGGGGSEYCELITNAEEDAALADVDVSDPDQMEELSGRINEIAEAAPEDIRGDWETFATSIEAMAAPEPPAEDQSADITTAIDNIGQHVQDECGVDMSE